MVLLKILDKLSTFLIILFFLSIVSISSASELEKSTSSANQTLGIPKLKVTPLAGYSLSVYENDHFNSSSRKYQVENRGGGTMKWEISAGIDCNWITIKPNKGELGPRGVAFINVSVNEIVTKLDPGTYDEVIHFMNKSNGSGNYDEKINVLVK